MLRVLLLELPKLLLLLLLLLVLLLLKQQLLLGQRLLLMLLLLLLLAVELELQLLLRLRLLRLWLLRRWLLELVLGLVANRELRRWRRLLRRLGEVVREPDRAVGWLGPRRRVSVRR